MYQYWEKDTHLQELDTIDLVSLYLEDVKNIPLLTMEEETALAKKIEDGVSAKKDLDFGSEKKDSQVNDLLRIIQEGLYAREKLISSNFRLVINIAKKYKNMGVPFSELIQEGNIGLIRAVDKYEFRRGTKLSTAAVWWIRESITRYINNRGRTIRIPLSVLYKYRKIRKTEDRLISRMGREPSVEEIAEDQSLSQDEIKEIYKAYYEPISFDFQDNSKESIDLEEFIPDIRNGLTEDIISEKHLRENLEQAFNYLPPRESLILRLYYGWIDGDTYTMAEIGNRLGLTRERIRQLKDRGLSQMKNTITDTYKINNVQGTIEN
jgi:RNA polymerase primary sigma factor